MRVLLVVDDREGAGEDEACGVQECAPLALAALFAAGDDEHVEVAHELAFDLRIGVRDERWEDELDDQQSAIGGEDGAAVFEHDDGVFVLAAVQDVFEQVDVGACGDGVHEIGGDELAAGGRVFGGEAWPGGFDAGLEVDQHAAQMGVEGEHGEQQGAAAAAEVGDDFCAGEVPGFGDGSVVFRRGCAHDGAEDGVRFRVLRPAGGYGWVAKLRGFLAGPHAVGEERPVVGDEVGPEDDGGPDGVGDVAAEGSAEGGETEVFGCGLFEDAEAGESAQQTVEGGGVGLTVFGEEGQAAQMVAESVGDTETSGGAEDAAAGVRHSHLEQCGVRRDVADRAAGVGAGLGASFGHRRPGAGLV